MPEMSDAEYKMIQDQLVLFASMSKDLDLDGFIQKAEKADTVGPFIDPTLWTKANGKLRAIIDMAKALKTFQQTVKRIQGTI